MKMISKLFMMALLGLSAQAYAHDGNHGDISMAKAAELALHRVGKLIDLGRIDKSFAEKFAAVQITALPEGGSATYKAVAFQGPGADGTQMQVEIQMDNKGKALSFRVINGAASGAPSWPGSDPLVIPENAFHYVLDNSQDSNIKPFNEGLTEMILVGTTDSQGQPAAKASFKSSHTTQTLEVLLKLDGTFIDARVVN